MNTLTEDEYYNLIKQENIFNLTPQQFLDWLETQEIPTEHTEFVIRDWNYIKLDIYAEIGNAKWGKNISYKIKSLYDTQMIESINYLK